MRDLTPGGETARLAALALYQALDTPPEFAYDALTELAAQICGCPVALISLVDDRRQWFKSKYGLPADFVECPRDMTVCSTTICSNDLLYVPELTSDDRFKSLPLVTGEPYLRFYCGMPLINPEGHALGTLCVVDFEPRELSPAQREAVRRLAQQTIAQLELRRQLIESEGLLREAADKRAAGEQARARAEGLLRRVLPDVVAAELRTSGKVEPRYHESTSIVFADFKGFTRLTETLDPARLLGQLGQNFTRFDEIAEANNLQPLKTIGDAYVCAGGIPEPSHTHAFDACLTALQMQHFVKTSNLQREKLRIAPWELRVGVNSGSAVAGVLGTRRITFDVWGSAVDVAQSVQEAGQPGRVTVSASTLRAVEPLFETEPCGEVKVEDLVQVDIHYLNRIRPEFSADQDGVLPNDEFWKVARTARAAHA